MVRVLKKLFVTVVLVAVLLIPTWLFLWLRSALNPQGFWEKLATGVVGLMAFGGIQLFLVIALIALLVGLWRERGRIW